MDQGGAAQARVICTLGMHRSGTSLVSRMLGLLGVQLGPDERVLTAGEDNPKGYWEHRSFVDLNDEILARFGGQWDEPPAFPASWHLDPGLADLRERARELVARDFGAQPVWGWKDPRTCLTLPFWQHVIGPLRYVVCVRNPCAVAASLTRRSGMSAEKADRLWLRHVQATLAHTSGQPRVVVFYEDLIDEWQPELRRLAAFVGHPERAEDPRVREAVGEFLEREMCHHRMSMEDLAGDPRISFPTQGLYLALRGHLSPALPAVDAAPAPDRAGRGVHKALDLLGARALEAWERAAALSAVRDRLAGESQAQAAALAALATERDRLAAEAGALAAERDRLASEAGALGAERDRLAAAAAALGQQASALAAECRQLSAERSELELQEKRSLQSIAGLESSLRAMILDRDGQAREAEAALRALEEIGASSAWRLVTFARSLITGVLPAGTRRRRAFDVVLRRLARRLPAPRSQRTVAGLRAA
jgi:hypothetical protein